MSMSASAAFTVEETAERLRLSRGQIFILLRTGKLGSYKIGRCRRIGEGHIAAYLHSVDVANPDSAA